MHRRILCTLMLASWLAVMLTLSPLVPAPPTSAAASATLRDLPMAAHLFSNTFGHDNPQYAAVAAPSGFRFENAVQGLRAQFDKTGLCVTSGGSVFGLALQAYGDPKALTVVTPVEPQATANRIEYARGTPLAGSGPALTEWYVNGPLGLEQGFTLARPPAGDRRGGLTLLFELTGNVQPQVDDSRTGLLLRRGAVLTPLRYTDLSAWDASGRELTAWLELDDRPGALLQIHVDDTDARYPLTIDPYMLRATLTNVGGVANDQLGIAIAMSADGSTIVVGANGVNSSAGAAYVFVKGAGSWATTGIPVATLSNASAAASDELGWSVATSSDGSTIVVGAQGANNNKGAAYVYVKGAGIWASTSTPTATLTNSGGSASDALGHSVAISADGSTIVAGADGTWGYFGAAYVFVKGAGSWASTGTPAATLNNAKGANMDMLGSSVAISADGSIISAGAPGVQNYWGAVYVFLKGAGGWATTGTPTATLRTITDGAEGDHLGNPVAISADGSTIVASAAQAAALPSLRVGAAYVFVKGAGGWVSKDTATAKLTNAGGAEYDFMGSSVAISADGSAIVAGAQGVLSNTGAAYVFVKGAGSWTSTATPTATLTNSGGTADDHLGSSAGMSGDGSTIVVGAYGVSSSRGAAYVFPKGGGSWTSTSAPLATLTNSGGATGDRFGFSVASSANASILVVGAYGVNGGKGAAYVFVKGAGSWATSGVPTATLTNSSGAANDHLGGSVAISADGTTIVVGANGVNSFTGAVYVYVKGGGSWRSTGTPTARLTNSGGAAYDHLGDSVAISGDGSTIVAGAIGVNSYAGAAYVYVKGTGWTSTNTPTATLANASGAANDFLGSAVAINGDASTVVVGASGFSSSRGAAYVFVKEMLGWATGTPVATLTKTGGAANDHLGCSVAIGADGSTIVVGAYGVVSSIGAAYVYARGTGWVSTGTPAAVLINLYGGSSGDQLGSSVATSQDGSTIVAGAPGVNSGQGAAYVFLRGGSSWTSEGTPAATLADPNAWHADAWGYSVAIGTGSSTIVVGANQVSNIGATYVFVMSRFFYLPLIRR